jgi:glycosyltransferase involved in cell wall biosynthesis
MNICMLSAYPPQKGGVPVHTRALAGRLSRRHRVLVLAYGGKRRSEGNITVIPVPVINVKFLRGLSFFIGSMLALRRLCGKEKIAVIHAQYMHPPGTAAALYRRLSKRKVKLFITAHGSDVISLGRKPVAGRLLSWAGNSCDRLVCVSGYLGRLAEEMGVGKYRIKVVQNGLDHKELPKPGKQRLRSELGLEGGKIVTFAGTLNEAKGADIFLVLAEHMLARDRGLRFVLVGDGPERKSLEDFCHSKLISGFVRFAGAKGHEETLKYLKASDVIVVPSRIEGFGMTALEGMALGVPVVASGAGALPEILSGHSITDNLSGTLKKALYERKFRETLVRENRKLAGKLTAERMADETEKLYRAIGKPP